MVAIVQLRKNSMNKVIHCQQSCKRKNPFKTWTELAFLNSDQITLNPPTIKWSDTTTLGQVFLTWKHQMTACGSSSLDNRCTTNRMTVNLPKLCFFNTIMEACGLRTLCNYCWPNPSQSAAWAPHPSMIPSKCRLSITKWIFQKLDRFKKTWICSPVTETYCPLWLCMGGISNALLAVTLQMEENGL